MHTNCDSPVASPPTQLCVLITRPFSASITSLSSTGAYCSFLHPSPSCLHTMMWMMWIICLWTNTHVSTKISVGEWWEREWAWRQAGSDQQWAQGSMAGIRQQQGPCSCKNPSLIPHKIQKSTSTKQTAGFSRGFSKLQIQKSSGNPREILQKSGCWTEPKGMFTKFGNCGAMWL